MVSASNRRKRGIRLPLANTFSRWRDSVRRITQDTLNGMDENESSSPQLARSEIVDELFTGSNSMEETQPATEINSRTSIPQDTTYNSVTASPKSLHDDSHGEKEASTSQLDMEVGIETRFSTYDAVADCKRLRQAQGEPFYHADLIWRKRRKLWLEGTPGLASRESDSYMRHETFTNISKSYYPQIYKKLVVDDKPLKEPMNLADALKVIDAGWYETKKWANAANGLP